MPTYVTVVTDEVSIFDHISTEIRNTRKWNKYN